MPLNLISCKRQSAAQSVWLGHNRVWLIETSSSSESESEPNRFCAAVPGYWWFFYSNHQQAERMVKGFELRPNNKSLVVSCACSLAGLPMIYNRGRGVRSNNERTNLSIFGGLDQKQTNDQSKWQVESSKLFNVLKFFIRFSLFVVINSQACVSWAVVDCDFVRLQWKNQARQWVEQRMVIWFNDKACARDTERSRAGTFHSISFKWRNDWRTTTKLISPVVNELFIVRANAERGQIALSAIA